MQSPVRSVVDGMITARGFGLTVLSVMSSRTVVALLLYLLVNVAIDCGRPLRNFAVDRRQFLDQSSYENKSSELGKLAQVPDVLILGSSLAMSAIATADCAFMRKPFPPPYAADYTTYTHARYLQSQAAVPGKFFNFACPGFKICQELGLLTEVIAKGNPKFVVIMVAPRDFIDDVSFEHDQDVSLEKELERQFTKIFRLYAVRGDFAYLFAKCAQGAFEHPDDPLEDVLSKKTIDARLSFYELSGDETNYLRRYKSIDRRKYQAQTECLSRMLAYLKSRRITALVVNMPLPEANLELLDKDFYEQFLAMLRQEARLNGAGLLDLQPGFYSDNDFRDFSHLRHPGGLKCCRAIAQEMSRIIKCESK